MSGLVVGCGGEAPGTQAAGDAALTADASVPVDAGPMGLPVLGRGTHRADAVQVRVIATAESTLATPRDLAFNPEAPRELWITNFGDSSMTILRNTGAADQDFVNRAGPQHTHFMSHPSCLAFGAPGILSTAHEEDQRTQGPTGTPADFMGPTLWLSGYDVFNGGHASHIDMLHNSPNAQGIAWESANIYWVADGFHHALTRYDFRAPHEPGGVDHSGATVQRFAEGEISYVEGVSGHVEFDHDANRVYFADPGNHRVGALDPSTGRSTTSISPNYDGSTQRRMMGADTTTLFDGATVGMMAPSGLALSGGRLFVTDNATSRIYAISLRGEVIDWLDLATTVRAGGLQGITLDADGRIYVTDAIDDRVLEIAAR
ncbi:MAG: hypothetical protein EPO40_22100 [Myxococcaceae bacterium]|nr:MAG: hypothetical protein EPO40_22100 [Myxococcaceae bacterium]